MQITAYAASISKSLILVDACISALLIWANNWNNDIGNKNRTKIGISHIESWIYSASCSVLNISTEVVPTAVHPSSADDCQSASTGNLCKGKSLTII